MINESKGGRFNNGIVKVNPKEVKEFHTNDDVDSGKLAHHHTLGDGVNQAAPGRITKQALDALAVVDVGVLADLLNLNNKLAPVETDLSSVITASAGWTINSCLGIQWGPVIRVVLDINRTGAAVVVGATGNISPDVAIATGIPVAFRPTTYSVHGRFGRPSVQWGQGRLSTAGAIDFVDGLPGVSYATGVQYVGEWTFMVEGWTL